MVGPVTHQNGNNNRPTPASFTVVQRYKQALSPTFFLSLFALLSYHFCTFSDPTHTLKSPSLQRHLQNQSLDHPIFQKSLKMDGNIDFDSFLNDPIAMEEALTWFDANPVQPQGDIDTLPANPQAALNDAALQEPMDWFDINPVQFQGDTEILLANPEVPMNDAALQEPMNWFEANQMQLQGDITLLPSNLEPIDLESLMAQPPTADALMDTGVGLSEANEENR
ncbi:hypothetical protein NHQ30_011390 [Ciborinia camelliae]|nr:hypothetical protein NHQ30_011390 [Ciborinia camelliae]